MLRDLIEQHLVIQAPMAGVQGAELAVAVCEAGGIGSLPAAMLNTQALRSALQGIQSGIGQSGAAQLGTGAVYNVNFFCHQTKPADPAVLAKWRSALEPYYAELNADRDASPGPARAAFSEEALAVLRDFKPPIVSFHFGLPVPQLLHEIKGWGTQVLGCATSVEEAVYLEQRGVHGIIAQGLEAGGHQGSFLQNKSVEPLACLELVQRICAVVNVPVIAAGGIATREHAQAALAMGAVAVQVGSAYLQAHEANTSALHRAALQSEAARHTALTNLFSGRRARGIVNRFMRELGPISDLPPAFPHAAEAVAPLRSAAEQQGKDDFTPLWSGEYGYLSQALSAAEITRAIKPICNPT